MSRAMEGRGSRMVICFVTVVQRPLVAQTVSVTLLVPGAA